MFNINIKPRSTSEPTPLVNDTYNGNPSSNTGSPKSDSNSPIKNAFKHLKSVFSSPKSGPKAISLVNDQNPLSTEHPLQRELNLLLLMDNVNIALEVHKQPRSPIEIPYHPETLSNDEILSKAKETLEFLNEPANTQKITAFILNGTPIQGKLPEDLCKMTELTHLSFFGCEKMTHLPDNISVLSKLRSLDISNTSIKTLPEEFFTLNNLLNFSYLGSPLELTPEIREHLTNKKIFCNPELPKI